MIYARFLYPLKAIFPWSTGVCCALSWCICAVVSGGDLLAPVDPSATGKLLGDSEKCRWFRIVLVKARLSYSMAEFQGGCDPETFFAHRECPCIACMMLP